MPSIFSRIIQGEIPCYKILENDQFLAFLDVFPLVKGHVLVIPKLEIDYIFDMDDILLSEMILFSKQVAIGMKAAIPCIKIGISVIGIEVPHAHIHLIPMNNVSDMNFNAKKLSLSTDEMTSIANQIKSKL
ncbi:MAG: HIT family protein [Saprospiraceae bacterium]|nr:HIT family protein [Saprospiraceae bacterium]